MQTDTGTIRTQDETRTRRAPRAVLAAVAATAVVAAVAIAVPASLDDTPSGPVVQPITVDTSLPAIGFSHVRPARGPLSTCLRTCPWPLPRPAHVPKQGALGG